MVGLEFVREQVQKNEYTSLLVGFADAHLKVAQLRVPGETIPISRHHIELVEYIHPAARTSPLIPTARVLVIGLSWWITSMKRSSGSRPWV
jgi:hypothetical protein